MTKDDENLLAHCNGLLPASPRRCRKVHPSPGTVRGTSDVGFHLIRGDFVPSVYSPVCISNITPQQKRPAIKPGASCGSGIRNGCWLSVQGNIAPLL
jgi:hypothetical protein